MTSNLAVFLFTCRCLATLEQSCFACQENEEYLAKLEVESGVPPLLSKLPFVQWLTMQIKVLSGQKLGTEGLKRECFRSFLGLVMNITEGNEGACNLLLQSDGIETLCNVLAQFVLGSSPGAMDLARMLYYFVCHASTFYIHVQDEFRKQGLIPSSHG